MRDLLNGIFTQSQLRAITKKRRVMWESEDVVRALMLRGLSKRAFNFVRQQMHIPLPGLSTCKKWVSDIKFSPGVLYEVIEIMSKSAKTMTKFERQCVILIDEMSIDCRISYDHSEDVILGPFKNVQVIMARGLTKTWKQPIFYDFNFQMTKACLFEVICEVEKAGFEVVALTSDLGGGNRALWIELGITTETTWFLNPYDQLRNVFVFADAPHLLKLLRNHLIDSGFYLSSGTLITSKILADILVSNNEELKLCPKFSEKHLLVKGAERMKVSYAAQTFSRHVASAIRHLFPHLSEIADFFQLINDAFDVLNSRSPTNSVPLKSGYGLNLNTQNEILNLMKKTIAEMRIIHKKKLLPFQQGFITTITSLQKLYEYEAGIDVSYILTSRVNQDCLESFFSQIRSMGRTYDQPLPSEFKYRLRLLLLSGQLVSPASHANVTECEKISYLTAKCLKFVNDEVVASTVGLTSNEVSTNKAVTTQENEDDVPLLIEGTLWEQADDSVFRNITEGKDVSNIEEDALKYIAGYICFKVKEPVAGGNSGELASSSWIQILSRGNLIQPTNLWMEKVKSFEIIFRKIHGDNLKRQVGIVQNLFMELKREFPEINEKALFLFSRLRIFIRIKYLNKCLADFHCSKQRKKNKQWLKSRN